MPILELKSYIAIPFLAAGIVAVLMMFDLMGRSERKLSPNFLRRGHKVAGFIFVVLLGILSYLCIEYAAAVGDRMSHRAVFHSVLALGLIGVLLVKVLIVQFYREFMRFVPALGVITFILAFVVFFTSAGYFFLREAHEHGAADVVEAQGVTPAPLPEIEGDPAGGETVFSGNCASCHASDSEDWFIGPGLKGILARETFPESRRPATVANLVSQIVDPVGVMPAFSSLSDREMADLLAYMKTL
jgi:mono/diheme cytochrome c family protein